MEKTYHIFRVYDYKGGELSFSINLEYEDLKNEFPIAIEDVIDRWEWEIRDSNTGEDTTIEEVKEFLHSKNILDFFKSEMFAGGDSTVFEIFECVDNILNVYDYSSLVKEMIEEYCQEL